MEQYAKIQQILKKEEGQKERKPIYPPTVIQAVFDAKTGASLEAILAQFNSIYVQYQGTPQATRCIIPKEMRRAGLTITYMNMDSETITERAASAVQKDNDHWGLDINWSRVDELSLSGDISVSAQGTWIINGEDTGIKALGPKGDAGLTPWLKTIDNRLHFSYDNVNWEPCSEPIAAYFRFNATSGNTQSGTIGKIQISRDNKTWNDLSPEFTNNLHIAGYVATTSALPANKPVGTIYGVGPTYADTDTAQTNPIYRLYVYNGTTWVDNGQFTSIAAGIVQETGDSETQVMSQKAVSEKLTELAREVIYDVSANNDGATFASLSALLSSENLSALIPTEVRYGGMSIRFVQSSDNKYVQFRLMSDSFNTTVANWQGVDDEPTAGSNNLVKSGGVLAMDDWNFCCRVIISFPNDTTIVIGTGIIYFFKGSYYYGHTITSEQTFDLSGSKYLVFNISTKTFAVKTSPETNDIILIYHDGLKGFCCGLLYSIYQNTNINDSLESINAKFPQLPYTGYFARGTAKVDDNNVLSISAFDLYTNKKSFDRIAGTKTVQLSSGTDILWFDLSTKELSISTTYNENSVFVGVVDSHYKVYTLNGIGVISVENNEVYEKVDKNANKKLSELSAVPDEILEKAYETLSRINEWKGNNEIGLVGQVTDLHAARCIDICKAIKYLNSIKNIIPFEVMVNGGDLGLDSAVSDEIASIILSRAVEWMDSDNVWLFCKGNHDYRNSINAATLQAALNTPTVYNHDITYGTGGDLSYGYYDNTRLKFRYMYINTSEGNTNNYIMSATQLKWIITSLASAASDYGIIVMSHMCIDAIGRWNSYPDDASAACFVALRAIFKDFVGRASGSYVVDDETITWDFTSSPAKLVCVFSGDSHFDNYIKRDGVNYIVRQGYGVVNSSELPSGATFSDGNAWLNKYHRCCFDVLAVNRGGGAKVFRIGIGGADRDLAFTY